MILDAFTMACVVTGSALGGAARYAVSEWIARRLRETFPWGTLAVNASGATAIGIWAGSLGERAAAVAEMFFVAGFLGSYTTVSTFALQAVFLAEEGRRRVASGYVLASAAGCLVMVAAGFALGRLLAGEFHG